VISGAAADISPSDTACSQMLDAADRGAESESLP
jgi:hypothetical protein